MDALEKLQGELDAEKKRLEDGGGLDDVQPDDDAILDVADDSALGDSALGDPDTDVPVVDAAGNDQQQQADATPENVDYKALYEQEKQRNEVVNGKYMAEVPRLNNRLKVAEDRNKELDARVKDLEGKLAAAGGDTSPTRTKPDASTDSAATATTDPIELYELTDEEKEYGPEVISMAEKIARKIIKSEIGDVRGDVSKVTETFAQQQQARLMGELATLVPDWQTINASTEFGEFCDSIEPNSGLTNQQILDAAQQSGDPVRISNVFRRFKVSSTSAQAPSSGGPTAVDKQVMPSTTPTPQRTDGKREYTLREYETLMDNITKGLYPPEKAEKMRRELLQAGTEGRVK